MLAMFKGVVKGIVQMRGLTTPLGSQSLVKKRHRINDLEGCFGVFYGLKELYEGAMVSSLLGEERVLDSGKDVVV